MIIACEVKYQTRMNTARFLELYSFLFCQIEYKEILFTHWSLGKNVYDCNHNMFYFSMYLYVRNIYIGFLQYLILYFVKE